MRIRIRILVAPVTLAVSLAAMLPGGSFAQSRDMRGASALNSPLGPAIGPGYGAPPPPPYGSQSRAEPRSDARRNDARESVNRSADVRRSTFSVPDLESEAQDMRSANRASAIEEAVSRDPRMSAGARERQRNASDPAAAVFGSAAPGGTTAPGGITGNASSSTGARSGGLSGGSVFGSISGGGSTAR